MIFFLWYVVQNFLWTEVGDWDSENNKIHFTRFVPVYDSIMIVRTSKQLCNSGMASWGRGGVLNEKLRTMRNSWNVPDKIISPSSEITTADFCITNLWTPCITVSRNGHYMKCYDHDLHLQDVILILNHFVQKCCCKPHIGRIGMGY